MNLPMPEYGKNDKETINILMDTVVKLRKELEYVLYHLDEQNIPMMKSVVGDIDGAYTAIDQTQTAISLMATDLTGAIAQITIQADQITSVVSTVEGQQTQINQNAGSITLLATTVDGHSSQISIQADQISSKVGYGEVVSSINQTSEEITIDAERINMYGITAVNDVLQIGYMNNDSELWFKDTYNGVPRFVRLYSNLENLYVDAQSLMVNGHFQATGSIIAGDSSQINGRLLIQNLGSDALVSYGDISTYGTRVNIHNDFLNFDGTQAYFNTDHFKVSSDDILFNEKVPVVSVYSNQGISIGVSQNHLMVYNFGTLVGNVALT